MPILSSPSVLFLVVLSIPIAQAQVSKSPAHGAQTPVITVKLGTDETALVKTAQGITTRIAFPERVTESICGDLYDPASGRGTFVVQNSGSDVFLKPVASKGVSNLFVMTGEGANRQIYHFDLNVVSASLAFRVVNVVAAAPARPPASAPEPLGSETIGQAEGSALKELPKQTTTASSNPFVFTTSEVAKSDLDPTGEAPGRIIGRNSGPPEPLKLTAKTEKPQLEPTATEEQKQRPPGVIRKSSGVVSGDPIRKTEPAYPPRARAAGISGTVAVEVTVDESGNVVGARALSGHPLLIDAAVSAARGWKFNPTKVSGEPVKVVRTITFNFTL